MFQQPIDLKTVSVSQTNARRTMTAHLTRPASLRNALIPARELPAAMELCARQSSTGLSAAVHQACRVTLLSGVSLWAASKTRTVILVRSVTTGPNVASLSAPLERVPRAPNVTLAITGNIAPVFLPFRETATASVKDVSL